MCSQSGLNCLIIIICAMMWRMKISIRRILIFLVIFAIIGFGLKNNIWAIMTKPPAYISPNNTFNLVYKSANLSGHDIAVECNPGGGNCDCSNSPTTISQYAQLKINSSYAEVISNPLLKNTYTNAIGEKRFIEKLPNGKAIALGVYKYTVSSRLPTIPRPDVNQQQNGQVAHIMLSLYDGRDALWQSNKNSMEAVIYWDLNPWGDLGKIKIYTSDSQLIDTGIRITPDTNWHTFEIVANFKTKKYVSIKVDGQFKDLSTTNLILVPRADQGWDNSVSLFLTTESEIPWPGATCGYKFYWNQQYKDMSLYISS